MAKQPNILVFLTDDHGQWAMGCSGNKEVRSPSMDYLAKEGVRMTNAFTPCPVCSPARASFFTGKIPSAHGIHDYLQEGDEDCARHPGIRGQNTLPAHLQQAGYYTGLSGKWHCNHCQQTPDGFDEWFTMRDGTHALFAEQWFFEGDTLVEFHGHQADFITDRAVRFLDERPADKPFFLFVGYTNTHTPPQGEPERLVNIYREATFDDIPDEEVNPVHGLARQSFDKKEKRAELQQYYAAVTKINECMGRVVDSLENRGELDNTLIVYTGDHGHMNGHHGLHCKGNTTVPQNFLEESIRIPCIMRWPGHIGAGQLLSEPVDHCDLFATLLDAAGADWQAIAKEDNLGGKSYLPLITGGKAEWRETQICEYGNARMARTSAAKLIRRYPGPIGHFPDEFYDLADDPRENENRIDDPSYADVIAQLDSQLDAHFTQYEVAECSGKDIDARPKCNKYQPWAAHPGE